MPPSPRKSVKSFRKLFHGSQHNTLSLRGLPSEIWSNVAFFLDRRSVINLALTCQFAYYACEPALYRTLTILHPGDPNYHEDELLERGHLGHVRRLRVKPDVVPDMHIRELAKVLPLIPGMRDLELEGSVHIDSLGDLEHLLNDRRERIRSLKLSVKTTSDAVMNFAIFKHLRVLDLTACTGNSWFLDPLQNLLDPRDTEVEPNLPSDLSDSLPLLTSLSLTVGRQFYRPFLTSFALWIWDCKLCWDHDELHALDSFLKVHRQQLTDITLPCWQLKCPSCDFPRKGITAWLSLAPVRQLVMGYRFSRELALSGASLMSLEQLTIRAGWAGGPYCWEVMSVWPDAPSLKMLTVSIEGSDELDWLAISEAYPALEYLCVDWTHAISNYKVKQRKMPFYFPKICPKLKWVRIHAKRLADERTKDMRCTAFGAIGAVRMTRASQLARKPNCGRLFPLFEAPGMNDLQPKEMSF
ncbi:hypothetical protein PUNSTDRAFT_46812 [Punctularia strigosozonata HHB-11173 SS5]|uniref:uncharacterized protein n=1 Tax=Punctularia strigosozonata (strain HHB-11173) TaxID=741275 RepID=UPI00044182B6|nr:uncharacterized protein PUNSTDRAFT_46812 [Punctularia strigosozonata HHB-11173 SS5]EIN05434.1 hypothetical protein PUNSTDRAFT_46812 [Punctularia strigosozonata HHB-11173 SS5]